MAKKLLTRRRLLTASGAAASLNIIKPGTLFGAEKSSLSKLSVGFIGMGGQIQTRLVLDDEQKKRANKLGIKDVKRKYNIDDMIKGDVMFCASAITDGDIVDGIKDLGDKYEVSTFALHKNLKIFKKIKNYHLK